MFELILSVYIRNQWTPSSIHMLSLEFKGNFYYLKDFSSVNTDGGISKAGSTFDMLTKHFGLQQEVRVSQD